MLEFLTFRRLLLVLTVQLTTLLQGMSITVISVVLPQMKGTLSATQDQIAWTVTFNLVATAIATPMTGWLAARLGWRNLLVGTVIGFTIATVLCGTADLARSPRLLSHPARRLRGAATTARPGDASG